MMPAMLTTYRLLHANGTTTTPRVRGDARPCPRQWQPYHYIVAEVVTDTVQGEVLQSKTSIILAPEAIYNIKVLVALQNSSGQCEIPGSN
jgi:hypothetical protein